MGSLLVILSAFGFSTLGVFARLGYDAGLTRNQVLVFRFALALPFLALVLFLNGLFAEFCKPDVRKKFAVAMGLGLVGIGIEATLYFLTFETVGGAMTGILFYLYPTVVALLSFVFLSERLSLKKWGCILLSIIGCVLTVDLHGAQVGHEWGILYGIATAVFYAGYLLVANRVMKGENPLIVSSGVVTGAFIAFLALSLLEHGLNQTHLPWPFPFSAWCGLFGLALIGAVLPFTTLYAGMKRVGPTQAAVLSTLEMVFTVVLAAVFLGEKLTLVQLGGAAVILISVLMIQKVR